MRISLVDVGNSQEFHVRVHNEFDPALVYPITAVLDPEYTFVFRNSDGLAANASEDELHDVEGG